MRGRRHKLQVSTFPFLAVLLCAMGSLILILLVMDRKAHKAAQARAQREAARLVEESAQKESAQEAEREQLKQQALKKWEQKKEALHEKLTREQVEMQLQMRKVREQLQRIAARLHYEQDTTTQLRHKAQDERSRLQAEETLLRTLHSNAKQSEDQAKESSQALRRMTLDLLQIEQVLKDLKTAKQREQKTFSVVPYYGRRGENRRPLYVECTSDGVIFHPERKAMSLASFIPGSNNPAGDVRSEVERRIAQQSQKLAALPNNADRTPYLLLLLRPGGVTTYHLLQQTLRGLPLDFGYEFIDDDWVLDFPADDELPSTQPWMVATKTPARSAPPLPVAASSAPNLVAHPIGGAPMGDLGGAFTGGLRVFRAGESGANGSLVRGSPNQSASPGGNTSGIAGGAGSAIPGGGGANGLAGSRGGMGSAIPGGSGTTSLTGVPGGAGSAMPSAGGYTGFPGSQGWNGNGGNGFGPPNNPGSVLAYSSGSTGTAANSGRMDVGFSPGGGHGHPSAMPPNFLRDDSGNGYSDDGNVAGTGYRGIAGGLFRLSGPNPASGSGSGYPVGGSPSGPASDMPGLGPPSALSSGSGDGYVGNGSGRSGGMGIGFPGSGIAGNGVGGGGGVGTGIPGSAPGIGTSTLGSNVIARANDGGGALGQGLYGGAGGGGGGSMTPGFGNGSANGSSQPGSLSGQSGGGTGQSAGGPYQLGNGYGQSSAGNGQSNGMYNPSGSGSGQIGGDPGFPGGGSAQLGGGTGQSGNGSGQLAGGSYQPSSGSGQAGGSGSGQSGGVPYQSGGTGGSPASVNGTGPPNGGSYPSADAARSPASAGSSGGSTIVIGGVPNGQAPPASQTSANTGRGPDVVVFVDPLTGQPSTAPRPTAPPADGTAQGPPPGATNDYSGRRRVQVVPITGAASGGANSSGEEEASTMNRFTPTPMSAPPARRLAAPRPAWIHGGRDWTIYVECRAGDVMLYPSQRTFPLAQAIGQPGSNPLIKAIQQMIDRRQSSRQAGEPPYHPQVCLLVRPEHVRTFLTVYPALEALPVPKTRRSLDADDDVIGIVTGAVP